MDILIKDVPCYYELSWRNNPPTIVFRIHKEVIKEAEKLTEDTRIVKYYQETFEYESFSGDLENLFGFNDGLSTGGQQGKFIELHGVLPKANTVQCACDDPENCFACEGTQEKKVIDKNGLWLLTVNIDLLLRFLNYQKIETTSNLSQLMIVKIGANSQETFHGWPN